MKFFNLALCSLGFFSMLLLSGTLLANDYEKTSQETYQKSRPDARAPIGVIDERTEKQGQLIFSYRLMSAAMEDNRDGSRHLAASQILAGGANTGDYMVAPLEMNTESHLFSLLYGLNDKITLAFTLPYLQINMLHAIGPMHPNAANQTFLNNTNGLGDIKVAGLFAFENNDNRKMSVNIGMSFPSGSINKKDDMDVLPPLGKTQLPFPMQLGSGTLDFSPGFTYQKTIARRSWGSQFTAMIRLNENENGYTLGDRVQANLWHAWLINKELSFSTRLVHDYWGNTSGDDNKLELPKTMTMGVLEVLTIPTIDPENQGGEKTDIALGANTVFGTDSQHRIALELSIPIYQRLNGPQIDRDLSFVLGYQITF